MTTHASRVHVPTLDVTTCLLALLRVAGATLLGVNAGIHAYLWDVGYRSIPTIGVMFLLDVIAASVLTLAVVGAPRRWLGIVATLGALLEAATAAGLYLATQHSLFGFTESTRATLYWPAVNTEIAGTVVLAALVVLAFGQKRHSAKTGATTSWW